MGIESDQLVFDYLSRVGDLAHRQQLSSHDRIRLVTSLRGEIDRRRAQDSASGTEGVRSILAALGTPDEVVARVAEGSPPPARFGSTPAPPPSAPPAGAPDGSAVPSASAHTAPPAPPAGRTRRLVPRPGRAPGEQRQRQRERRAGKWFGAGTGKTPAEPAGASADGEPGFSAGPAPQGPHLIGLDEMGPAGRAPRWWSMADGPFGDGAGGFGGVGELAPGFQGGFEIPEMLKPPPGPKDEAGKEGDEDDGDDGPPPPGRFGVLSDLAQVRRIRRERAALAGAEAAGEVPVVPEAPAPRASWGNPLLLIAAGLLVAGAVTGFWPVLVVGWLLAYASRRLSRTEAKLAVFGVPGTVAVGAGVWFWGRAGGRWGEPLPPGQGALSEALGGAFPVVVRIAAVASALYLVWRARRL
ncbi:hypothetical protein NX801_09890 [Streptomyces sp. LP05-1]|uniref:Integral membrane protein n=1 Tax=Streptomyces pyxinae TaxID=2970734 RepID=A0ABT2CF73_9ACTN|nr:hypothetical protein [Streptomyces sp. LP05-1]MCS0635970.1 hypothetical protein [Streptomyces sp. LP05-1]